ncbi:hypothetical protein TNCV_598841 [Trichonephila clavipes]|nr:hypothetical protein TNCV_598841 [Trichonephila clavipes]
MGNVNKKGKIVIFRKVYVVTKPITPPHLLRTPRPFRQSYGNSSLFITFLERNFGTWSSASQETHQQCVLFAPDPGERLKTDNVYPDMGARGVLAGMCRNDWERLSDNSSKEPSPIGAEKGKTSVNI